MWGWSVGQSLSRHLRVVDAWMGDDLDFGEFGAHVVVCALLGRCILICLELFFGFGIIPFSDSTRGLVVWCRNLNGGKVFDTSGGLGVMVNVLELKVSIDWKNSRSVIDIK